MRADLNVSIKLRGSTTADSSVNDRIDRAYTQAITSLTKSQVQDISMTASQTGLAVTFASVTTAKMVMIFSDQNLKVGLNGNTTMQVGKFYAAYGDGAVTSITLDNMAAVVAAVTVVLSE